MDKNTRDNDTIRGLVANDGGNTEYNHLNTQGEREKTYTIIQTTKQGTPVPQEIQEWYQDAINIHDHYTTEQGLHIMKTNTETQETYPQQYEEGVIYLKVDNETATPYNAKIPNYPEDYNAGSATIRESDGRNTAISETGGAEAFKEIYLNSGIQYELDNEGNITGLTPDGYKAFRIIQMYDGLTYPDGGVPTDN